jgi:hypothetical protein
MGLKMSKLTEQNPVNYGCPKCKDSGKLPNIAGRFHIINETECQCNGCKTIYPKSKFYKTVVTNATPLEEQLKNPLK